MYFFFQQVQSGVHQRNPTLCGVSSAALSPSLSFPGTSLHPMVDLAPEHAESNGTSILFLADNNSPIKSETPQVSSDEPLCAKLPAVEVAKTLDYPSPQTIPEGKNGPLPLHTTKICWTKDIYCSDSSVAHSYNPTKYVIIVFNRVLCVLSEMLHGWWRLSDVNQLCSLVKALHSRGIREKVLQKQIQKHMEYMTELCANSRDGTSTSPLFRQTLYITIYK